MSYRDPSSRPVHSVLDVDCRKCGVWGHDYVYFPVNVDAGPLCRDCFVEWRGVALGWRFGTVGVGLVTWPVEERARWAPRYAVVEVDGEREYRSPLPCPPPKLTSEEIPFLSRLVKWLQ